MTLISLGKTVKCLRFLADCRAALGYVFAPHSSFRFTITFACHLVFVDQIRMFRWGWYRTLKCHHNGVYAFISNSVVSRISAPLQVHKYAMTMWFIRCIEFNLYHYCGKNTSPHWLFTYFDAKRRKKNERF